MALDTDDGYDKIKKNVSVSKKYVETKKDIKKITIDIFEKYFGITDSAYKK